MKKRIRRVLPFLLAAVLIALLVACSGAATPAPLPEQPEEVQPTPMESQIEPEQATAGEISTNVATYAVAGDIPSLDPPYMLSEDTIIGFNVYETLTRWTPDNGIIPILATEWESNPDGTEWTFTLREGVTFHDGTPLTANDVKVSLERNMDVGMVAYDFIGIESIEAIDEMTVLFTASEPRNVPLIVSAQYGMFIYSAEAAEHDSDWFNQGNDAGTGPYMIQSFEPGKSVVVEQYKDYWGGWEEGQFTRVIFEVVEEPTVRDQLIRSGQADITFELPFDSMESLQEVDGITVRSIQQLAHLIVGFDLDKPPLDTLEVRKALAHSFPYEAVRDGIFLGYGEISMGNGPNSLWDPPADFPHHDYDLDRSTAFLQQAGLEDGFTLKLALSAGSQETLDAMLLWQAELAKLNIQLDIQQLSGGAFWDYAYNPDNDEFHIFVVPASGDVPSPYAWLICYTSSPLGWMPYVGYNNPDFDKLVFDAWAKEATDSQAAQDLWVQAQRILYEDAASIFALDYPYLVAYRNDLTGFVPNPPYPYIVFFYDLRRSN